MKLYNISEDIKRSDFFDFYLLVHARHENPQLESAFKMMSEYIYDDHINQITRICINRLIDTTHQETL